MIDRIFNREINPGKVFDLELPLEQAAEAYQATDHRRAIKVLLTPEPSLPGRGDDEATTIG